MKQEVFWVHSKRNQRKRIRNPYKSGEKGGGGGGKNQAGGIRGKKKKRKTRDAERNIIASKCRKGGDESVLKNTASQHPP